MQSINISGHEFTTIATLKAFAIEHGINIKGIKLKADFIGAIESYFEVQAEVVAQVMDTAVDAEASASEASEVIEVAVVSVGSLVVAALTSDEAVKACRHILKFIVFAVIITWMFSATLIKAIGKWAWANKHHTAVYHWIVDWMDSQSGKNALTHGLIAEWVMVQWVDTMTDRRNALARHCRAKALP